MQHFQQKYLMEIREKTMYCFNAIVSFSHKCHTTKKR